METIFGLAHLLAAFGEGQAVREVWRQGRLVRLSDDRSHHRRMYREALMRLTILLMTFFVVLAPLAALGADVTVLVTGAAGPSKVLISLCSGGLEPASCPQGETATPNAGQASVVFTNVPPGSYAIAAFQDENGDRSLNRSPVGLPLERYGFSNGVGKTAPPRFQRAAFPVSRDVAVAVTLNAPPSRRR